MQNVKIEKEELQSNLLLSHSCGLGEEMPDDIVKLMIILKIKSLSYEYSGIVIVADGTDGADSKLSRVLRNDPGLVKFVTPMRVMM